MQDTRHFGHKAILNSTTTFYKNQMSMYRVGKPPPATRKRPDVTAKKLLDIAVVKSTLNSFCTKEDNDWNGLFINLHRTTIQEYVFANYHVQGLCKAGLPVLHISLRWLETRHYYHGLFVRMFL